MHHDVFSIHTNLLFLTQTELLHSSMYYLYNLYTLLQRMQQEFQESLAKRASLTLMTEQEPHAGTSMDPSGSFPLQVLKTHQQHAVDYTCLMMGSDTDLTMGEDRVTPLITEVFPSMSIS